MAKAYERMGMLNVSQHSGFTNNESSAIYAIDSVDLKLFNALQSAPSIMRAHQAGTVYAIHPVDLKLFDAAGNAPAAVAGE